MCLYNFARLQLFTLKISAVWYLILDFLFYYFFFNFLTEECDKILVLQMLG